MSVPSPLTTVLATLTLLGILIPTIFTVAINKRQEYNEVCNATSKCNRSAWLNCQDGLCACVRGDEMQFDPLKGKCVSKAGKRCKFEITENIFERTDCVANATCGSVGICECLPFFLESENGTCLSQRAAGETCTSHLVCRTDRHLKCIEGICACDPNVSELSTINKECIGLAGNPCLSNKCTTNSICGSDGNCTCRDEYFRNSSGKCEPKREYLKPCTNSNECKTILGCWNGTCTCQPNQSKWTKVNIGTTAISRAPSIVSSGTCWDKPTTWAEGIHSPNYPADYNDNEDCYWQITAAPYQKIKFTMLHSDTECHLYWGDAVYIFDGNTTDSLLSNLCRTSQTTFESSRNQMLVYFKTDGSITHGGWEGKIELLHRDTFECVGVANKECNQNRNCVKHAQCSPDRQCVCEENYAVTSKGECGLLHGKNCDANEDVCSDSFICNDGKSACRHPYRQIYNVGQHKCTSLVSGPCATNEDCIGGTFCNITAKTGLGVCECEAGRVENSKWTCDLAQGSICHNSTVPCDSVAGLKCRNGICSCPDDTMLFSTADQMCLGLAHFRCSKEDRCVENAECVVLRKGLPGVCKCKDGFEETRDRMCVPNVAENKISSIANDSIKYNP